MSFLIANLPPIKVYVKKQYLYDHQKGHGEFVEGVWISCKSIQGRALYFETYLPEYGALYDKLPISAFVDSPTELDVELEELELWDAFKVAKQRISKHPGQLHYMGVVGRQTANSKWQMVEGQSPLTNN